MTGKSHLSKQLTRANGEDVTEHNLQQFIKKDLLPRIRVDQTAAIGLDGIKRQRVYVEKKLLPEYVLTRGLMYKQHIKAEANRWGLPPELIITIIHTESYFNPLAKSGAGAYGLMQVIPKYAGREAYQYLCHEDQILRPDYLYNPDNNIRIGSTHLHLLLSRYFSDIKDLTKRDYLAICSYNWGPTVIRKKVLGCV